MFDCLSKFTFGQGINITRQQKIIHILSPIFQNVNIHNKQFPKPKEIARRESFGRDRSLKANYFLTGLLALWNDYVIHVSLQLITR